MMSIHKYFCTFPQELISEPIISHTLGEKFGVVPNIRAASITDTMALVAVEIEGTAPLVINRMSHKALEMMKEKQEAGEQSRKGKKREATPSTLTEFGF